MHKYWQLAPHLNCNYCQNQKKKVFLKYLNLRKILSFKVLPKFENPGNQSIAKIKNFGNQSIAKKCRSRQSKHFQNMKI